LSTDAKINFIHPTSGESIPLSTRWRNAATVAEANQTNSPQPVMLLAHGAGANLDHLHMQKLADSLASVGISSLRFNFPFMELGKRRTDAIPICMKAIDTTLQYLISANRNQPILLAGHSFGGRMMSHYVTEISSKNRQFGTQTALLKALIYFSFPLHGSGKPDTKRALHMPAIELPQLFISGTRDALAETDLLVETASQLDNASIHWLETADHGFKILKRTRKNTEDVYLESARVIRDWLLAL